MIRLKEWTRVNVWRHEQGDHWDGLVHQRLQEVCCGGEKRSDVNSAFLHKKLRGQLKEHVGGGHPADGGRCTQQQGLYC